MKYDPKRYEHYFSWFEPSNFDQLWVNDEFDLICLIQPDTIELIRYGVLVLKKVSYEPSSGIIHSEKISMTEKLENHVSKYHRKPM